MPWLRHFAFFVVFVTALFSPAAAGAFVSAPAAGSQARVGAFAAGGVGAAATTELQVAERVAGQLADARLGALAGRTSAERLQTLASNPNAMRYLDTASGHTNVVQWVEGRLPRITVADGSRIISVGPIQRSRLRNGVANGRFVPIAE